MKRLMSFVLVLSMVALSGAMIGCAKSNALTLGSWRVDDVDQINKVIDAFNKTHPDIKIQFKPTNPPEYNAVLQTQLSGGTGPDIMYLRPFSVSRGLYSQGFLEVLDGSPGLANFDPAILDALKGDDGKVYGVPLTAVSHAIYYNVDLFKKNNISIPKTWEDLLAASEKLKAAGVIPFSNGLKDAWDMNEIVFMNLIPNFIGGRNGRLAYESGKTPFNDAKMVTAFEACKDIAPYMPDGKEGISYYDAQQLFIQAKAAMFFGGSWDVGMFDKSIAKTFEWGVFATPAPKGKPLFITFHTDIGLGINKASAKKEAAKVFLDWMATAEAAQIVANELPGMYPMIKTPVEINNVHAAAFYNLNSQAKGLDVRLAWPKINDAPSGKPSGYGLMQDNAIAVVMGKKTAKQAADDLAAGLAQWYKPTK